MPMRFDLDRSYCDQKLSSKQAWEKHKKRKHSTIHDVDWVDLLPVQTSQESVSTEETTDGASAAPITNLHIPNPRASSSSQEDKDMNFSTQDRMQPITLSYSESQQNHNPLVSNADQQNSTTHIPIDLNDIFLL